MSVPKIFVPHSVQVKTVGGAVDDWIDQIVSSDVEAGVAVLEESGSGESDREFVAVRDRQPTMSIVTTDLSFLAVCGMAGISITPDASNPGLVAWGKNVPNKGRRDDITTASHLKLLVTDGLLIPTSIQGAHNQAARLSLMLHAILGSAAQSGSYPMVFTKDQQITSGASQSSLFYTACAVKYTSGSSKLVTGIMDMAFNPGIEVFKESSDAEVDPTHVSIRSRLPTFEFSTSDGNLLDDVGEDGLNCTSFAMYFQKFAANGTRVAKASSAHISIVSTSGHLRIGSKSLPHNQKAMARFTFVPAKDTNLVTLSSSATIPTS